MSADQTSYEATLGRICEIVNDTRGDRFGLDVVGIRIALLAFETEIRRDCVVALGEGIETLRASLDEPIDEPMPFAQPESRDPKAAPSAAAVSVDDDGNVQLNVGTLPTLPTKD
jgi:hypothetical protein